MSILPDRWIREQALARGMIEPFVDRQTRQGVISYGLSSYGYDARVADEFKVFTNVYNTVVDPKHFDPKSFVDIQAPVEGGWRSPAAPAEVMFDTLSPTAIPKHSKFAYANGTLLPRANEGYIMWTGESDKNCNDFSSNNVTFTLLPGQVGGAAGPDVWYHANETNTCNEDLQHGHFYCAEIP